MATVLLAQLVLSNQPVPRVKMAFSFERYTDEELLELHIAQMKSVLPGRTSSLITRIRQEMKKRNIPTMEKPRFMR